MKRNEEVEKDNSERWLLTYSDLITLLMIFFVIMYTISNIDSKKYNIISRSLSAAMGNGTGSLIGTLNGSVIDVINSSAVISDDKQITANTNNLNSLKDEIEKYLSEENMQDYAIVETDERGLAIRLKDSILFDSGKADVKDNFRDTLIKIGKIISRIDGYVRVEGYTDNIPINNREFKSNWQLSAARAVNVVELLIDYSGISPEKISAVGYGEYRPIADNSTSEGRAKNRRVEIVVINSKYNSLESANAKQNNTKAK